MPLSLGDAAGGGIVRSFGNNRRLSADRPYHSMLTRAAARDMFVTPVT